MAPDEHEAPATALARLEGVIAASDAKLVGKIDGLSQKIDLKHEKVLDNIDTIRREGGQQMEFYKSALRDVRDTTAASFASFGARLEAVEKGLEAEVLARSDFTSRARGALAVLTFLGLGGMVGLIIDIVKLVTHH